PPAVTSVKALTTPASTRFFWLCRSRGTVPCNNTSAACIVSMTTSVKSSFMTTWTAPSRCSVRCMKSACAATRRWGTRSRTVSQNPCRQSRRCDKRFTREVFMKRQAYDIKVPPAHDWRTTDQDEINKRRLRARTEALHVTNTDAAHPIFSDFRVKSPSGMTYAVEIRDVAQRQFACECPDFRSNGLGTCKHVEVVLLHLETRHRRLFQQSVRDGSQRVDVVPDAGCGTLRVERGLDRLPPRLRQLFDDTGLLRYGAPNDALELLRQDRATGVRLS